MWINFPTDDLNRVEHALRQYIAYLQTAIDSTTVTAAKEALREQRVKYEATLDRISEAKEEFKPADPYRAAAKEQAHDELEIDDDAVVSPGSDPGAWVHAWIWISNSEAGLPDPDDEPEVCSACGEPLDEAGDGWDGKCADCADKEDATATD